MKKSKFTETQIVHALKEYEAGKSAADICRELGINKQTFYTWNKKYSVSPRATTYFLAPKILLSFGGKYMFDELTIKNVFGS